MVCESYRRSRGRFYLPAIRRSRGRFRTVLFTDDPTITFRFFCRKLPTIRRSQSGFFAKVTDDPTIKFRFFCRKLPTIRRSHFGFFSESYRRSDDQISVFFPKVIDDPTITFGFFLQLLDVDTSESALSIFFEIYRWSDFRRSSLRFIFEFTDDPTIIFLIIFTDDPTIIWKIFTDDPTITNMVFWLNLTDNPTTTIWIFWRKLTTIRRSRFPILCPILAKTETLIRRITFVWASTIIHIKKEEEENIPRPWSFNYFHL